MRALLLSFALVVFAASAAQAQDAQPLFGSDGTGILTISMPEPEASNGLQGNVDGDGLCTSEGCPLLQKAAMAAPRDAQQP